MHDPVEWFLSRSHRVEQPEQVPSERVLGLGPVSDAASAAAQVPLPEQRHLRVPLTPEGEQLSQDAPQRNALPQALYGGEGRTGTSVLSFWNQSGHKYPEGILKDIRKSFFG